MTKTCIGSSVRSRLTRRGQTRKRYNRSIMLYSAFCLPDANDGTMNLCIFLEGFATPEAAQQFLEQLMGPFEGYDDATSETVH